jgi:hypothetical protein
MTDDVTDLIETPKPALPATVPCVRAAHETFAQMLSIHGNKLAAYREAFPEASDATARVEAYKLANHKDVLRRVHELQKARRAALLAESEDLEAMVANLCHGKATRLVDEEGTLIPFHLLPAEVQAAIKGLKLRLTRDEEGNLTSEYEIQFPDPLAALRLLAQLRGQLVDRHDVTSAGKALPQTVDPLSLPLLDHELRKRLLAAPEPAPEPSENHEQADVADLL